MSTINDVMEFWETLDIETKEDTLEMMQKGLIEEKREKILLRVQEAKSNLFNGNIKSGNSQDLFKDLSDV